MDRVRLLAVLDLPGVLRDGGRRGPCLSLLAHHRGGLPVRRTALGLTAQVTYPPTKTEFTMFKKLTPKKALLPIALIAGALMMSACYQGNLNGPKVAVNGDSITNLSTTDIQAALAPNYAYNVLGQNGYTIADALPSLQTMLTDPEGAPQDVIVNLGTNNVLRQDTLWPWELAAEVQMLANTPCVVMVNVSTYADVFPVLSGDPPMADDINTAINQAVATHPNFHLLDWNTFVHTGNNFNLYVFQGDLGFLGLVHPNADGQAALASMYVQALQTDCH